MKQRKNYLGLNIADIPILIKLNDQISFSYAKSTLKNYLKPIRKPYFSLYVNTTSPREKFGRRDGIKIIRENGRFILHNKRRPNHELGFIDRKDRFCQLNIRPEAIKILFHSFLRSSFSLFLSDLGGFVTHSSGLIYKGGTYIFVGPSGSGKTTVASILKKQGLNVISDEKIVVRKKGSAFFAYAFPWALDKNQSAPLKNILFLKKSKKLLFERLNSSQAVNKILSNINLPLADQKVFKNILNNLSALFGKVPAYKMHFLKNGSFWQGLKGLD